MSRWSYQFNGPQSLDLARRQFPAVAYGAVVAVQRNGSGSRLTERSKDAPEVARLEPVARALQGNRSRRK